MPDTLKAQHNKIVRFILDDRPLDFIYSPESDLPEDFLRPSEKPHRRTGHFRKGGESSRFLSVSAAGWNCQICQLELDCGEQDCSKNSDN